MSIRDVGSLWKRIEPGWKVLTAGFTILTILAGGITWGSGLYAKASQVDNIRADMVEIRASIGRMERNQARMAEKFGIRIEDPR